VWLTARSSNSPHSAADADDANDDAEEDDAAAASDRGSACAFVPITHTGAPTLCVGAPSLESQKSASDAAVIAVVVIVVVVVVDSVTEGST
jgi:hypothetical protein